MIKFFNNIDWEKAQYKLGDGCGLMHGCLDRECDNTKSDCQECIKDANDAVADCYKENNWINMG